MRGVIAVLLFHLDFSMHRRIGPPSAATTTSRDDKRAIRSSAAKVTGKFWRGEFESKCLHFAPTFDS